MHKNWQRTKADGGSQTSALSFKKKKLTELLIKCPFKCQIAKDPFINTLKQIILTVAQAIQETVGSIFAKEKLFLDQRLANMIQSEAKQ